MVLPDNPHLIGDICAYTIAAFSGAEWLIKRTYRLKRLVERLKAGKRQ